MAIQIRMENTIAQTGRDRPLTQKSGSKNPLASFVRSDYSSSQLNSAFWACSRFSAWSKTIDRSLSTTVSVISSPR